MVLNSTTVSSIEQRHARLFATIDAPAAEQPGKLKEFVDHWYKELGTGAKSGRGVQAVPYPHPYWYKYGDTNFEGGAYFGRWCVEAVAAVKAFGLDDTACLGHDHYPGDLLRPNGPSTHPLREELTLPPSTDKSESSAKRSLLARLLGRGG
ncbi:PoNe immunity protein domain-containing protein [Pseudomonas indica]|uniref:PoNe immunity protein domain-containing protein n=1 Tax=Pseudomonas indica TaxID=137658 RepID=UPI000BABDC71